MCILLHSLSFLKQCRLDFRDIKGHVYDIIGTNLLRIETVNRSLKCLFSSTTCLESGKDCFLNWAKSTQQVTQPVLV